MPLGATHDRLNLFVGGVCVGFLIGTKLENPSLLSFMSGWFLSTFIFSPDTDLGPKKRTSFLRYFLYPYSLLFKHRGMSHGIFLGTLTRVLYGLGLIFLLFSLAHQLGHHQTDTVGSFHDFKNYVQNYDYDKLSYRILTWFFIGMYLADLSHVLLDRIVSFVKRIF